MKKGILRSLVRLLLGLSSYAFLMLGYSTLLVALLGPWVARLYAQRRGLYAGLSLGLIAAQGLALEAFTRRLLGLITPPRDKP